MSRTFALCLLFVSQAALAQPAPAPKPAPAARRAAPATALPPEPTAQAPAEPALPQVSDDMLAPVPPATNVLQSWRDALRVLRQNSTTLRSLQAQQDISRAQAREALAPALPQL